MGFGRWIVPVATGLTIFALAACSSAKHTDGSAASARLQSQLATLRQKQEAVLAKALAENKLKQQQTMLLAQSKAAEQQVAKLVAASDAALKQADSYRNQAAATKDLNQQRALSAKANQAQAVADEKAAELLAARRDIAARLQNAGSLQEQIEKVAAEKKGAEHLAQLEAQSVQRLEQTSQPSVARSAKPSDKDASLQSSSRSILNDTLSSDVRPSKRVTAGRHGRRISM